MQDKWLNDEGDFSIPERLGITELYFLAPNNLSTDSASRLTVGPLECVEASTKSNNEHSKLYNFHCTKFINKFQTHSVM